MACLTNTSVFTNGLGPGDVCSGRGECVEGICVCDSMWTGRADYLDLNGISCHYPILLDRILFGLAALTWTKLFFEGLVIFKFQLGRFRERRKGTARKSTWQALAPLDTIFFTLTLAIPCFIASAILRQWENFGVDPACSVVHLIALSVNWLFVSIGQQMMFDSAVKGGLQGSNRVEMEKAISNNKIGLITATTLYVSSLILCNIVSLPMARGITSFRIGMVVVRNMGGALFYAFHYFHSKRIASKLTELTTSMAAADGNGERAKGGDRTAIMKAIEQLNVTVRSQLVLVVIIVPILVIFTLVPQLYGYNQVPHTVLMILAAGRNHTLHAWAKKNSQKDSSSVSDSNNLQVAAMNKVVSEETKPTSARPTSVQVSFVSQADKA